MKLTWLPVLFFFIGPRLTAQTNDIAYPVSNTIPVLPSDSKEVIIDKAAHAVPTVNQYAAMKNEFIAFIHFGPNTFTRMEWGNGKEDPKIFDLKELHTDQWCAAMKDAGMKMVVITVKHHDGFVLWQSRYTKHGIMSSPYLDGKGDIFRALSTSCKKYGLKVGVYLSPADLYQIEAADGLYGNGSTYTERTIPRPVPGHPFKNKTQFRFLADDYNEYFLNQLFELLTEYGPVDEVWFDGAQPKTKGGQQYNYQAWKQLIKTLAPKAVVFGKEDIRWCGNESGRTRATEWNVIPYQADPASLNIFPDLTGTSLGAREELYKGKYLHYQQAETNTSIREGWFYRDDIYQKVRSADDVFDMYERSVGGNSTFLLNIPPNRDGKFSDADLATLREVGKRIRATYLENLFRQAGGPAAVLDHNPETYWSLNNNDSAITITTRLPVTINRVMLQEAIATHGERVEKHILEAWINNQWTEIAGATNIGYKRILRFPEITASRFRLRVLSSRNTPAVATIAAFYYHTRPPQLQFSRDLNGSLSIEPLKSPFGWKPHGVDAVKNLHENYSIYYTLDGTTPGKSSHLYTTPFVMPAGKINAIAIGRNGEGAVAKHEFGMVKSNWKLVSAGSEKAKQKATMAFDANDKTYWQSGTDSADRFIIIDLGDNKKLRAFSYTPQQSFAGAMMAKGTIRVSSDGDNWTTADNFMFGNLVNDPTTRNWRFSSPVFARYVRIECTGVEGPDPTVAIAELDFYE